MHITLKIHLTLSLTDIIHISQDCICWDYTTVKGKYELINHPRPPGTLLAPTLTNLSMQTGNKKKFEPVISRADLDEKMTKPKFKHPCPGSDAISAAYYCSISASVYTTVNKADIL
jgi:hypothetical protein